MEWKDLFVPESPLRSRRLQGALVVVAMWMAGLAGWDVDESLSITWTDNLNGFIEAAGVIWMFLGGLFAGSSPRKF